MNTDSKAAFRFSELVLAIVVVVVGLVWAERLAWNQINDLRRENHAFLETIAAENREAAQAHLVRADASLNRLQRFLFVALLALLASGATIIVLAYRRMLAPLRTRLTESRAIIERQEKLASLGVFAAGIAHEIRNPLTAIKVRLFSLKQSHHPGTSEHDDVEVIESEIARLDLIVKEFLQFARPADPEFRTEPVEKIFQEVRQLLESDFSRRQIRLQLEIKGECRIRADSNKFKQVLLNLAKNGAEAIAASGTVTLRARPDKRPLHGRFRPVILIDVEDSGSGIPEEVQKRLFDPFFTTKGEGTGLGLPIAARIVEKHGGAIEYQTAPDKGTAFTIILPQVTDDERDPEHSSG